ncbi:hypothetical protein EHN06_08905 [Marinobacter sp. NP-4(2019)]|uniref:hypothetical protein n=1 Tax=Marinobacter sp. NP-4(2019) TaxID=2488665 RepID=UPI000FC3F051|nr:hypothetical protein [Marinobacter sp. NP-4(2019)]AZT83649.1 hypothetical protein EHN06_08905 [Marinobacter sp. NP-4(2019)]
MNQGPLVLLGVALLAYSSTVMRHYAIASYKPELRVNVNQSILGGLPTLISFLHIPVFFWLPIFLVMQEGFSGLLVWLGFMVGAWILTSLTGIVAILVIHFWLATIASVVGIYLTVSTL